MKWLVVKVGDDVTVRIVEPGSAMHGVVVKGEMSRDEFGYWVAGSAVYPYRDVLLAHRQKKQEER